MFTAELNCTLNENAAFSPDADFKSATTREYGFVIPGGFLIFSRECRDWNRNFVIESLAV